MYKLHTLAILVLSACTCAVLASTPEAPYRLRTEYMENPVGVDVLYPVRFTWALAHSDRGEAQTKYRILVSQTSNNGDGPRVVWDSGMVASNVSQNVHYNGTTITPDTAYEWTVQWADKQGQVSPFASNATFTTGLYTAADWKGSQWIGNNGNMSLLRKSFAPKGPISRATAYVVGLGYYKLYANGEKISTHELGAFTTYERRVYYDTHDMTKNFQDSMGEGASMLCIGAYVGDGWYAQHTVKVGRPSLYLRLSIQYADGTQEDIVSDPSWKAHTGPVTSVDIYQGEVYDSRLEQAGWYESSFDDSGWSAATIIPPPSATVKITSHAVLPPIRIVESYTPCDLWESAPGVFVFDFCQNMAGFTTLRVPEGVILQAGVNISQQHAEMVFGPPPAGIQHHYSNAPEINTYITKGDAKAVEYTAMFTYAGFRYVQLTGYPGAPDFKTLTAHFIHTDYEFTGNIRFSDPMLDAVQHITRTAAMSNFQSIPTDCPQRERRGWLGDAQLSAETNFHNFDMGGPYTSFVQQINDAQDPTTGAVQDCVPWYGHGHQPADPAWGVAYTFLADWVGKYYHDNQIFAEHYDGIVSHLEELIKTAGSEPDNGLLEFGGWGDWCPPKGCEQCWSTHNSALVSSFYYISQLRIVARYAGILGKTDDQKKYQDLSEKVAAQFQTTFYDPVGKTYTENRTCGEFLGPQTTISLAYQLGVIPESELEAVMKTLVDDVAAQGWHLNVGIVGIKYLLPTLSANGYGDVALMVAQARTPPSYIYMVEQGATTLWETWTGTQYHPVASRNHIMFGSNSDWYYKFLAGIQSTPESRGWQALQLQPQVWNSRTQQSVCANLSSVDASVTTPRGIVRASWNCGSDPLCQLVPEKGSLNIGCADPTQKITSIKFANWGTPEGSCENGFTANPSCSKDVSKIVSDSCVGKSNCTLIASDDLFGDPCFDVVKSLAVQGVGCGETQSFNYKVTVPVGTQATVHIPTFGSTNALVTESTNVVWKDGKFVATDGIVAAVMQGDIIVFTVGSGSFAFKMTG